LLPGSSNRCCSSALTFCPKANWAYELKLDGYRALALKGGGKVRLRSRNDKDFNALYPSLVEALGSMPDETVLDGEVVALDEEGRPSFNALQNLGHGEPLHFFIFDLLILRGRDVMAEPLVKRRALIEKHVLPTLAEPIRYSPILEASLANLIRSVKEQGLKGSSLSGQAALVLVCAKSDRGDPELLRVWNTVYDILDRGKWQVKIDFDESCFEVTESIAVLVSTRASEKTRAAAEFLGSKFALIIPLAPKQALVRIPRVVGRLKPEIEYHIRYIEMLAANPESVLVVVEPHP